MAATVEAHESEEIEQASVHDLLLGCPPLFITVWEVWREASILCEHELRAVLLQLNV